MVQTEIDFTVNTDDVTTEQLAIYRQMADIFASALSTFIEKNMDYDSSFLTAGEIDQILDSGGGPFASAEEANLYKVFTRIQDKDQRFYSLVFGGNDDHVGESAEDTAVDAGVYWFMVAWILMYGDVEVEQDDGS